MKRILFLMAMILPIVASCSDDNEGSTQTFFVNVYSQFDGNVGDSNWGEGKKEIVKNASLYLFQDENKSIDTNKSAKSVANDGTITFTDGSKSQKPQYATKFQQGIFNMTNIQNGDYILWIVYMTEYGGIRYSSYKHISVNYEYRGKTEEKVFKTSMSDSGYIFQEW